MGFGPGLVLRILASVSDMVRVSGFDTRNGTRNFSGLQRMLADIYGIETFVFKVFHAIARTDMDTPGC